MATKSLLLNAIFSLIIASIVISKEEENDDTIIDSHVYREPGCPLVLERHGLNLSQVDGDWFIAYASISALADLGHALTQKHPKVSEIKSLCPKATFKTKIPSKSSNVTWEVQYKFPTHKNIEMDLRCWPQRADSFSKFECFFSKANIHTFGMISGTDHKSWLLFIRCKIGVNVNEVGEGMSWILFSKTKEIHPDKANVLFGLLEGYGFDTKSYKFKYSYDKCHF